MSNGSSEFDFEVEELVTGKSAATSPKKRPYQKPLLVEIDLPGNSQGKILNSAEFAIEVGTVGPS